MEAFLAALAAVAAVYFLASMVPSVAEHPVWVGFIAVPLMLVLAVVLLIVALAVVFLRWGDRRVFFTACALAVVATIVGAVVASWYMGCSKAACG
jgi:hypothetical protein